MPKQVIRVKTSVSYLEIEATVIGKFAYHPSVNLIGRQTITHVATGMAVADVRTVKSARELARKLDAAVVDDITSDRMYSEEYKVFARAVKSVVGGE